MIGWVMVVSWTIFMLLITDSTAAIVSGFMFFACMLYYFAELHREDKALVKQEVSGTARDRGGEYIYVYQTWKVYTKEGVKRDE